MLAQNLLAEKSILENLCKHGKEALVEIQDLINSNHFSNSNNQVVYKGIVEAIDRYPKVDFKSILNSVVAIGYKDYEDNLSFKSQLRELCDSNPTFDNLRTEAKKVAKVAIARELQNLMLKSQKELGVVTGNESVDGILGLAQKDILEYSYKMSVNSEEAPQTIGSSVDDYVQFLEDNPNRQVGIKTGFTRYDEYIGGGLRRKSVSLIGARAKTGKSTLGDVIGINVASYDKIPVLMLDTEMNNEDHLNKMLAYFSKVPIKSIESGIFTKNPNDVVKIKKAQNKIKAMPFFYKNVSGKPFEEIVSIMRRWVMKEVGFDDNGRTNDCLIIYDYLKLMTSENITNNIAEFQAMGFLITELHNFAVNYDCPILSFVQLNRDGINVEDTSAISQSDRLVWLCTNFSIFKPKSAEEIAEDGEEYGNRKLIPLVARHGPGIEDGNYINMIMQGEFSQIVETKTKFEIKKAGLEHAQEDSDIGF